MSDMYAQSRIEHIKDMIPKIMEFVEPNDRIKMGLSGDPLLSKSMLREEGVVLSNHGDKLKVKMDGGSIRELDSSTVAPDKLFEFTEDTFKNVMKRQMRQAAPEADRPTYRGADNKSGDVASLRKELREFQDVVVNTFGAMSKDISSMPSGDNSFSKMFYKEYRGLSK